MKTCEFESVKLAHKVTKASLEFYDSMMQDKLEKENVAVVLSSLELPKPDVTISDERYWGQEKLLEFADKYATYKLALQRKAIAKELSLERFVVHPFQTYTADEVMQILISDRKYRTDKVFKGEYK